MRLTRAIFHHWGKLITIIAVEESQQTEAIWGMNQRLARKAKPNHWLNQTITTWMSTTYQMRQVSQYLHLLCRNQGNVTNHETNVRPSFLSHMTRAYCGRWWFRLVGSVAGNIARYGGIPCPLLWWKVVVVDLWCFGWVASVVGKIA